MILIEKEPIMKFIEDGLNNKHYGHVGVEIITEVEFAPIIDATPEVHAYWIGSEYDGYADGFPVFDTWCCSACGEEYCSEGEPPVYNYCPNCGARMDGDQGG